MENAQKAYSNRTRWLVIKLQTEYKAELEDTYWKLYQ